MAIMLLYFAENAGFDICMFYLGMNGLGVNKNRDESCLGGAT